MNLQKAIEILSLHYPDEPLHIGTDLRDAMKLGIEAMKRFHVARKNNVDIRPTLLLGETEE